MDVLVRDNYSISIHAPREGRDNFTQREKQIRI